MKRVCFRSKGSFYYDMEGDSRFSLLMSPECDYSPSPDAIVLPSDNLDTIIRELMARAESGSESLVVVPIEKYRRMILSSVFDSLILVDKDSHDVADEIWRAFKLKSKCRKVRFTEMERRLVSELAYGLSTKELAERLGTSERSIRRAKGRLLSKTNLVSSNQLMVYSILKISTRSSLHSEDKE